MYKYIITQVIYGGFLKYDYPKPLGFPIDNNQ